MQFEESEYLALRDFLANKFALEYSINDKAHQIDHVIGVCDLALEINEKLKLGLDRRMIVIPAITHDLFTRSRSNHHHLACEYLKTVNESWILGFSMYDRTSMAFAALQHRASYKGYYSSVLSELIASADRGRPKDVESVVLRAYDYAMSGNNDVDKAIRQTFHHIHEKFSNSGYAKYPELYLKYFGEELKNFKAKMDDLTLDDVRDIVVTNR